MSIAELRFHAPLAVTATMRRQPVMAETALAEVDVVAPETNLMSVIEVTLVEAPLQVGEGMSTTGAIANGTCTTIVTVLLVVVAIAWHPREGDTPISGSLRLATDLEVVRTIAVTTAAMSVASIVIVATMITRVVSLITTSLTTGTPFNPLAAHIYIIILLIRLIFFLTNQVVQKILRSSLP